MRESNVENLVVVQEVLLNNLILDASKDMYYRSSIQVEATDDGGVKLYKNNYYDFFTFFNSLPIKLLSNYTEVKRFFLVLEVKGDIKVELFGHTGKEQNYSKEWISIQSYKCNTKRKIIIPIKSVFSEMIAFGIWCNSDSTIYKAYYAADVEDCNARDISIHIIANKDNDSYREKQKRFFYNENLSEDDEFKDKFCFSEYESGKKFDVNNIKDPHISDQYTHLLYIGDNYLSGDSLKRLYLFLRLVKKEYREFCIAGAILDINNPGKRIVKEKNTSDKETTVFSYSDLCDMKNVLEIDSVPFDTITDFDTNELICVPSEAIGKDIIHLPHFRINGFCVYGIDIKSRNEKPIDISGDGEFYKLQDILFDVDKSLEITRHMYYRSESVIEKNRKGSVLLPAGHIYDFFTYFNAFSYEKWKKYTLADEIYLILEVKGAFDIALFGHYKNNNGYQKELFGKRHYSSEEFEVFVIKYPKGLQSALLGFDMFVHHGVEIKNAFYATKLDKSLIKEPLISMVTTTFKKEEYVSKNIELLNDGLLNNDEYKEHFVWNIIDNGRTLSTDILPNDRIRLFENKNVGGAGGFAKGMIVSLKQKEKPDYILLMDDDVVFIPESFKRLYRLLSVLRDDYREYFISGAMLKMGQPNIQHEDTGKLIADGYHVAVKPNYDLNLWNHIIDNEIIDEKIDHQYGAWWFCCIPATVANLDNLPLPVFVRGDDVEYSIRNKAKLITMNGLCIWHEGFEGKFSAALEFYQVNRNELAVRAAHPELRDVDCIGHIKIIFWEEMYKFNYKGAALLLDAIEDYMKGPDFFKKLDGEKSMKKKRKKDNLLKPLTPDIEAKIDYGTLYSYEAISGKNKFVYDYTFNGQARIPDILIKNKTGVIPYGWGYSPGKINMATSIIAVDPTNKTYVIFKKDRSSFKKLKERYERVMNVYDKCHKKIEKEYQQKLKELTSMDFWDEYLK